MATRMQLCTFTVDDLLFGVDVMRVQEIIQYQHMTRVPLAPKLIRGLINLRGQIVMAVDLRERLDLPPRGGDEPPTNVVVQGVDAAVSLLVDSVGDVIEVSDDSFESPPATMLPRYRQVVDAVCKLPHGLLLLLDPERAASSSSDGALVGNLGYGR